MLPYSLVSLGNKNNNKNGAEITNTYFSFLSKQMEETKKILLDDSFTSAMTLTNSGVPDRYVLPLSQRPTLGSSNRETTFPIIDLSSLHQPLLRSRAIHEIAMACKEFGFFQVIIYM